MKTPPFLLGAAAAFWGWQSGQYLFAGLLAVALEAHRWTGLRLNLVDKDVRRLDGVQFGVPALPGIKAWAFTL